MISRAAILVGISLLVSTLRCFSQIPKIQLLDRRYASPTQVVSITGANFGTDPTKLAVFFGGAKGTINTVADQLIEVQTPFGTTFDKVVVVNTTSGLSSFSPNPFFLDFGGAHGFDAAKLQGQFDFSAASGLYDHCLCDFDGDGKPDVATANKTSNTVSLLKNNSSIGSFSFTLSSPSVGAGTLHPQCGDVNGDGLPDLILTEANGGTRIFIFRNLGGFSFNLSTISITGKKVNQLQIADLDADGKPEAVITDQGAADVIILPNLSTTSTISFGAPVLVPVSGVASTDGIIIADLDADNLPEIITSQFQNSSGNVGVLHNQSTPGNFSFGDHVTLSVSGTLVNLKIGDFDGDGLQDILATRSLERSISIFLNQSSSSVKFAAPQAFLTDENPWGVDFGDIDGDGKPDIVTASITKKTLTVLNNTSIPGNLSFDQTIVPTTYINRHVKIADMDGDGKPDITFTSIDDNNNNILASKISIFRNAHCMVPVVSPNGPLTVCIGSPLRLTATVNGGVTYQWMKDGTPILLATNSYLDVSATGKYTVTVTGESSRCSKTSNAVNVTFTAGPPLGTANPANNGPVCLKGTMQLNVNDIGATQYLWRGPNGYTGSGLTPPPVSNFTYANAGRYYLDVYSGTCLNQQTSTVVDVVAFPSFRANSTSSGFICQGQSATLTLVPSASNVSYQWFEQTSGALSGQTSSTLAVATAGNYFGKVTSTLYPACTPSISDTVSVKVISLPAPDFNLSSPAPCAGEEVTFTDKSVVDSQAPVIYNWDFGDASSSTAQNPTHTYLAASTVTVKLTVSYTGGVCPQSKTQSVTIQTAPPLSITSSTGSFTFCENTTITLQATGSGFDPGSYLWNNSATTSSITISTGGNYSVSAKASAGGCVITASQATIQLPAPIITLSADPDLINEGQPSSLTATGLTTYLWHPGKSLNDSTVANPVATPATSTLYIVGGKGANGCFAQDSILVNVKGEAIVNKLKPMNIVTPNGDAHNDFWQVENIVSYPQCGVAIYDEKGVKVFDSKPYGNDWGGTFNGKLLPNGVYYYIIRCDGENTPKTGSITLVR